MSLRNASTENCYTIKVFRFNPETDRKHYYDTFTVTLKKGSTVMDALLHIQAEMDDSIAFRSSCRSAVCGSCGMLVNGAPVLACRTQLSSVVGKRVLVEPLPNMNIIRDLVVDMTPFWDAYFRIEPWLHVNGHALPDKEHLQTPEQVKKLDPYINCILCACCYGSCPVLGVGRTAVGPAAVAKLFRFMEDTRDRRGIGFLERLDNAQGLWSCRTVFRCVDACPKDIRPTDAIESLRRKLVLYRFKKYFHRLKGR